MDSSRRDLDGFLSDWKLERTQITGGANELVDGRDDGLDLGLSLFVECVVGDGLVGGEEEGRERVVEVEGKETAGL